MALCPEVKCWRVWGRGFPTVSLLRGGHGEGDALRRRLLPLLRDRLDLGEELHAGLACHHTATTHVSSSLTQLFQVGKVHSDALSGKDQVAWDREWRTVEIQISCEGSLAACEGEEWQRYWNWDIDSHLN